MVTATPLADLVEKLALIEADSRQRFTYVPLPGHIQETLKSVQKQLDVGNRDIDHISLCYAPEAPQALTPEHVDATVKAMREVAEDHAPIHAQLQGLAYFDSVQHKGKPATALVALVNAPGLEDLQIGLKEALKAQGHTPKKSYSFVPHATIAYLEHGQRVSNLPMVNGAFTIDKVMFANKDQHGVPLSKVVSFDSVPIEKTAQVEPYQQKTQHTWDAFTDELEKIAWFGTYYHGTSPEAEKGILQEGFDASRGGKGGWNAVAGSDLSRARDAGRVYLTPSKTVAKAYGTMTPMKEHLRGVLGMHPGVEKISLWEGVKRTFKDFLHYQPLQVTGEEAGKMHAGMGLGVPGLEVFHKGNIPTSAVSKAQPSRLGNIARAIFKKEAEDQKCLRRSVALLREDPSLTLMTGPPDRPHDTRHFWVVTKDGRVLDPSRTDYQHYDQGRVFDIGKNPDILKNAEINDPLIELHKRNDLQGMEALLGKTATIDQDALFERIRAQLDPSLRDAVHHVSGGLPDVRRLSDVDMVYHTPTPQDLLSLMPKGTTVDHNDKRSLYNIPGFERPVSLYATADPALMARSKGHRDVELALAAAFPDLAQQAAALKKSGLGTEPAWAQVLKLQGDPYEEMLKKEEVMNAARSMGKTADLLPGGKGDNVPKSLFDPVEFAKGLTVESEHTKNKGVQREIATDHLVDNPAYYTKLQRAGLADELGEGAAKHAVSKEWIYEMSRRGAEKASPKRVMSFIDRNLGHAFTGLGDMMGTALSGPKFDPQAIDPIANRAAKCFHAFAGAAEGPKLNSFGHQIAPGMKPPPGVGVANTADENIKRLIAYGKEREFPFHAMLTQ